MLRSPSLSIITKMTIQTPNYALQAHEFSDSMHPERGNTLKGQDMELKIELFGGLSVWRQGELIEEWGSEQPKALLKILLTEPGQVFPHDQLIDYIWPDSDFDQALAFLRARIHNLRQKLEPNSKSSHSYIDTVAGGYRFNLRKECEIDTIQFEQSLKEATKAQNSARYCEAIELFENGLKYYRGDYLPEDRYEHWAEIYRRQFKQKYVEALVNLATCCVCEGQHRYAVQLCREAYAIDRLSEDIYRKAMTFSYLMGNSNQAFQIFEECKEILRADLGRDPDAATTELRQQIESGHVPDVDPAYKPPTLVQHPVHHSLGRLPFVGRERDLRQLFDLLKATKAGHGKLVLVGGEVGIGKTRLVQEAVQLARHELDYSVLIGRYSKQATETPYQAFISTLRSYLVTLDAEKWSKIPEFSISVLAPWLSGIDLSDWNLEALPELTPEQERLRFFEAIAQFIVSLADCSRPILFFLDDLQWADPSSIDLIDYVLNRISESHVFIIGTYRDEEVDQSHNLNRLLQRVDRESADDLTCHIKLERLDGRNVGEILAQCAERIEHAPQLSKLLYSESAGNPLFIVSLIQSLFEEEMIAVDEDGAWVPAFDAIEMSRDRTLPMEIQEMIRARIARMEPENKEFLDCISVVGQQIRREFLRDLWKSISASESDFEYHQKLEVLEGLNILHPDDDGYHFSHDKIREVVYESITGERLRELHSSVASLLERRFSNQPERPHELLAFHYQRAGLGWEAAHDLLGAVSEAVNGYRLHEGLELSDELRQLLADLVINGRDERELLSLQYENLINRVKILELLAERERHQHDLDELLDLVDQLDDVRMTAEVHLSQAKLHIRRSSYPEALAECYKVRSLAEESGDPDLRAQALHNIALVLWYMEEFDDAESYFLDELKVQSDHAGPGSLAQTYHYLGAISWKRGQFDESEQNFQTALKLRDEAKQIPGKASTLLALGAMYWSKGKFDDSLQIYEEVRSLAAKIGDQRGEARALSNLGLASRSIGDYEAALTYLGESIEIHENMGDLKALATDLNHIGVVFWLLGAYKQASKNLDRALQLYDQINSSIGLAIVSHNRALVLWKLGKFDDAIALFSASMQTYRQLGDQLNLGALLRNLGETYLDLGELKDAKKHLDEALVICQALSSKAEELLVLTDLANYCLKSDQVEKAYEICQEVIGSLDVAEHAAQTPQIWFVYHKVLLELGRGDESKTAVKNAHQALQALSNKIEDTKLKSSFLNNVAFNNEIMSAYGVGMDDVELSEEECYRILRDWRWPDASICPYCSSTDVRIHGRVSNSFEKRYLCTGCKKTFGDRTNTVFANSNLPINKLFQAVLLVKDFTEMASAKRAISEKLEIHPRTAGNLFNKLQEHWNEAPDLVSLAELIKYDK